GQIALDVGPSFAYIREPFLFGTREKVPFRWAETMDWRLRQFSWWLTMTAGTVVLAGCVERRFVINSDPQGAVVFQNGQPLGAAPADNHFVYYGKYRFTLVKDGYETLVVDQDVPAPWYEYPGLDFISENLVPFTIRDRREFSYHLEPARIPSAME